MLAKDFLFEQMTILAHAFPGITIKYEFNSLVETHVIELSPVEDYYENAALDEAWINITKRFHEKFPSEDISFISTDSSLKVNYPEFTFNIPITFPIIQQDFSHLFLDLSTQIDWSKIHFPYELIFQSGHGIYDNSIASYVFQNMGNIGIDMVSNKETAFNVTTVIEKEYTIQGDEDTSYALAA